MSRSSPGPEAHPPGERASGQLRVHPLWPLVAALAVIITVHLWVARPLPPLEGWGTDYEAALAEAAATDRKVVVAFHSDTCPPCTLMERTVLNTSAVREALADYVPVRLDIARDIKVAQRFGVWATPTYAVLDAQGGLVAGFEGALTVEDFVRFLKRVSLSGGGDTVSAEAAPPSDP